MTPDPDAGGATAFRAAENGVSPIHWRVPSASGARLVLTGCRFDRLGSLPAVRAFGSHAPVANLGILGAIEPIRADVPTAVQDVPLLSTG